MTKPTKQVKKTPAKKTATKSPAKKTTIHGERENLYVFRKGEHPSFGSDNLLMAQCSSGVDGTHYGLMTQTGRVLCKDSRKTPQYQAATEAELDALLVEWLNHLAVNDETLGRMMALQGLLVSDKPERRNPEKPKATVRDTIASYKETAEAKNQRLKEIRILIDRYTQELVVVAKQEAEIMTRVAIMEAQLEHAENPKKGKNDDR